MISQTDFYRLPAVVDNLAAQRHTPAATPERRTLHLELVAIATEHGVEENFDTAAQYDEGIVYLLKLRKDAEL